MSCFAHYIDSSGLHMPTYEDRLADLVSAYSSIFGVDAELSESVADIYANLQGESTYTRDEISCPWNSKISILNSGGLTITFRD